MTSLEGVGARDVVVEPSDTRRAGEENGVIGMGRTGDGRNGAWRDWGKRAPEGATRTSR